MSSNIDRIKTLAATLFVVQVVWATVGGFAMAAPSSGSINLQFQKFRQTPENETPAVSDRATMECSVKGKTGVLKWTKDGFGLGTTPDEVEGWEGHTMKFSEDEENVYLEIYPFNLKDDVFQCQMVGPEPEVRSANATLTVEVPTSPPEIIQGNLLQTNEEEIPTSPPEIIQGNLVQVNEDEEVQLECISRGGRPAGDITWLDGRGHVIKSGVVETIKERLDAYKRFETRSILRFQASREHHNKTVTCQASNRPAKEAMSTSIRLEVKYVSVEISSRYSNLFIVLSCAIGGVVVIAAFVLFTLLYQRKKKRFVLMNIDDVEKQTKQSYKSLNDSDLKVETGTASFKFVFNIHDEKEGSSALKNDIIYQHADCVDSVFPPKNDGHVPFADYKRNYNRPPLTRKSIINGLATGLHRPTPYPNNS